MKKTMYKVWVSNCNYEPEYVLIEALNQNDALILARAERIKDGLDYTLHSIEDVRRDRVSDESVYELSKISKPSFTFITQSADLVHSVLEQFVCDLCIGEEDEYYNMEVEQQIEHLLGTHCGCDFILQRYESYDDYYMQTRGES